VADDGCGDGCSPDGAGHARRDALAVGAGLGGDGCDHGGDAGGASAFQEDEAAAALLGRLLSPAALPRVKFVLQGRHFLLDLDDAFPDLVASLRA
jgi:hypothetical protein